jgi:hydrogenase nickel incorporation protein HypA/HybF
MHELGIAKDLWAAVKSSAKENSLKKITKIVIHIGKYSGIEEDFLRHSIADHIIPGTFAKDAELEFIIEQPALKCPSCGHETNKLDHIEKCPKCKKATLEVTKGHEVYVAYIEGE